MNNFVGQYIWRKLQDLSLKKKYQEDKCFRLNMKKRVALAFDLTANDFKNDEKLLDYFESIWIDKAKRRVTDRKKPEFLIELQNIYDRVNAGLPSSNNSIEG